MAKVEKIEAVPPALISEAQQDAKRVLSLVKDYELAKTSYGTLSRMVGISVARVQAACIQLSRTTGIFANTPPSVHLSPPPPMPVKKVERISQKHSQVSLPSSEIRGSCPKIHYGPDDPIPADWCGQVHLWCGTPVGVRGYGMTPRRPVSYYWSKKISKVTCRKCEAKYLRIQSGRSSEDSKSVGIVEVV